MSPVGSNVLYGSTTSGSVCIYIEEVTFGLNYWCGTQSVAIPVFFVSL